MNGKIKKNMGLSMLPLAFFFLFEPGIASFDIIPDFIGYFIICSAIYNMSDMCYHIDDARRGFFSAAVLSIGKLLSLPVTFGLFDNANRPVAILLFAFIFATLELIVLIPAFKRLFDGILYLGERVECSAPYSYFLSGSVKRKKTSRTNVSVKASVLSTVFIISRAVLGVLPEFTSLIESKTYRYVGLLRGFAVIVSLTVGLVWLVYMLRYFASLKKDKPFVSALEAKYREEVSPRTDMFTMRTLITSLSVFTVAVALSVDIFSDYYNLLPDFISAALLLIFLLIARKHIKNWRIGAIFSIVYGAVSAASWGYSLYFYSEFYPEAIYKSREAYFSYYTMLGLDLLASAVCIALIGYLLLTIYKDMAVKHTGRVTLSGGGFSESGKDTELLFDIKKRLILLWSACIVGEAFSIFNVWAQPMRVRFWLLEASAVISIAMSLIYIIYCFHAISELKHEIFRRYKNS